MNAIRDQYRHAIAGLDHVLTSFADDRWDDPTPCLGWTARMLAGHVIDGQRQVVAVLSGQTPQPVTDPAHLASIAGSAPVERWASVRAEVEAGLGSVPAGAIVCTPAGDQTVEALLGTAVIEPLVHSWDLAVAADTSIDLDAGAVRWVLSALEDLGGTLAATGMYAPAWEVDDAMTAQQRLLALTGRDPAAAATRTTGGCRG